jgi:voltage-gated potassium channel Kch
MGLGVVYATMKTSAITLILSTALLMFTPLLLAQQIDPDLRGVWKLNVEKRILAVARNLKWGRSTGPNMDGYSQLSR